MKILELFFGIVMYLCIGGMLAGAYQHRMTARCDTPQPLMSSADLSNIIALWPGLLAAGVVANGGVLYLETECVE